MKNRGGGAHGHHEALKFSSFFSCRSGHVITSCFSRASPSSRASSFPSLWFSVPPSHPPPPLTIPPTVSVSPPCLRKRLAAAMDGCLQRYFYFYGSDQRIAACVSEIGVPFTEERGFHQLDIRGDPFGFLAAHPLAPLVSLHHMVYLDSMFPNQNPIKSLQTLMRPYTLDPYRILQQINCHDRKRQWSISISWGYSIQIYTYFLTAKELETPLQTFKTWRSSRDGPFTFNTRPLKPDPCERPVTYFMDGAEDVRDSGTKTWYSVADKNYGHCGNSEHCRVAKAKRILVTSMKMDPEYWSKAPRSLCCEVMERGGGRRKEKEMLIRIRKCRTSEKI